MYMYLIFFNFLFTLEREKGVWGREGGRERERQTDLLFHPFTHSLVDSHICPEQGLNPQPWLIEKLSNQLSYP